VIEAGLISTFFLHILISEQFPELFITHRHSFPVSKKALPNGRAFGLLQPYCQGPIQWIVSLLKIAYSAEKSKKMIDSSNSCQIPTLFSYIEKINTEKYRHHLKGTEVVPDFNAY